MEITLGGERVGSGNKNQLYLKNFERSTHDLSQDFVTTAGPGILYPCLCIPTMRGDVFDIGIKANALTIPTRGPMFSTYKMQIDLYQCPVRLYQALLHNNPTHLGLNMSRVKLPKLRVTTAKSLDTWSNGEFASNCLLKYLGMSGIGRCRAGGETTYSRLINAVPPLAYYDIFKNYYANKQEDNAYYICASDIPKGIEVISVHLTQAGSDALIYKVDDGTAKLPVINKDFNRFCYVKISAGDIETITLNFKGEADGLAAENIYMSIGNSQIIHPIDFFDNVDEIDQQIDAVSFDVSAGVEDMVITLYWLDNLKAGKEIAINTFPLSNIDDMRMDILSMHTLGTSFVISKQKILPANKDVYAPYSALTSVDEDTGITDNQKELNGLCIKTYQSDLFNNWINYEWVEGENGIAEMSKIAVTDGAIYMDALLFAQKTYNLLNRIAVAGGTYEDWQDVVYEESPKRHMESPMYVGGLSSEIVFEQIVQTAPAEGDPLGSLGGKGICLKRKGGNSTIHVDEASFIIGIMSITPRIYQTQGNEFYMTELDSVNDLHKPNYDGLGFQNLMGERMCWTDTVLNANDTIYSRTAVGKVPAWIEYMTAVDKAYGEFTDVRKQGYMILNRNYTINNLGEVQDFTTYVDPAKYNYVWGKSDLLSQNFWVQINFDIKARRKMSAKQIPNL